MAETLTLQSLDIILEEAWQLLQQAVKDRRHPMHLGTFATVRNGTPEVRTVVLRGVCKDARQLFCHTDIRSAKIEDLRTNPNCAWLFYHPELKIQLRFVGKATVWHRTLLSEERWEQTQLMSRRCYATLLPPGTRVSEPTSGLPDYLIERSPTKEESETGKENFAVIETKVHALDWLWLDAKGHRRAKFEWENEQLSASWAIP